MFAFGIEPPTPEQIEEHKKMSQMHNAHVEASQQAIYEFIRSMKPEQLVTFRTILADIENVEVKGMYDGLAQGALIFVHGVCKDCGIDHTEEEMEKLVSRVSATKPDSPSLQSEIDKEKAKRHLDIEKARNMGEAVELMNREIEAKLKEYNVEMNDDDENDIRVMCMGCRTIYPSLADRMLKQPNDCSGCHQKAKFG